MNRFRFRLGGVRRGVSRAGRGGFTLIELLIVVAIMGVLLALLSGGLLRSVESAKKQRRMTEARALQAAIANYWHDYNKWPYKKGEEQDSGDSSNEDTAHLRYFTSWNWRVFNRLSERNKSDNPLGKPYLDEASLLTTSGDDGKGTRITLQKKRGASTSANDKSTLVDFNLNPYLVIFDLRQNTVNVAFWVDDDNEWQNKSYNNENKWRKVDRER